ncbi:MAG: hypothetical protein ABIN89_22760 [Chitinophagaceae bacterium]
MKKVLSYLFVATIFFLHSFDSDGQEEVGRKGKELKSYFPEKILYNVVVRPESPKVIVEAFKDNLVFKMENKVVGNFIIIHGPLPVPPSPCEPAICREITFTFAGKGKYLVLSKSSKDPVTFTGSEINNQLAKLIDTSPNKQLLLRIMKPIDR